MSETTIEITVSGDNAAETLAQIADQLPQTAQIVMPDASASDYEQMLVDAVEASAALPARIADWFAAVEMSPLLVVAISLGIFVGAYLAERVIGAALAGRMLTRGPNDDARIGPVSAGLWWGMWNVLRLVSFLILCRIGMNIAFPEGSEAAELSSALMASVMLVRVWYAIIEMLCASRDPARRPTGLDDGEASFIMSRLYILLFLLGITNFTRDFVVHTVDAAESGAIFAIVTRVISGIATAAFFIAVRKPVSKLILLGFASDPDQPGRVIALTSKMWPVIYIVLLVMQFLSLSVGHLNGAFNEGAQALNRSFAALVLAPFLIAGVGVWRDHLAGRAGRKQAGRIQGAFSLLEGMLIVGTAIFIMYAWNVDPFATDLTGAQRILPGLVSAAIVTVIGMSAWRTASALFEGAQEPSAEGGDELPDGEGGVGGSRIETVLPILRAVVAAFIGIVTVLLALSSLGVEIAPLLAGAGILGLAVGFGAQKVVEDVISGVLYLVEDAFRKGEYIETSQGKGVVEAIMLRSVRLRHHLGPVFTIPFSSMGTIQNHSRDWVTVKLSFEVAPDQDLEKVRKLIKKVGTELLEDPELEGQFLAPLKSQGAVALVGANYKIGVKFTSEPGKQFLIRRKALNAIQKAFKDNGIEMAAPRVIVDSHDQIGAAAAKALTDAQAAQAGPA